MPTSLPDLGYDEAVRVAELGSDLLKRADAVDAAALAGGLGLTCEIARGQAKVWSRCSYWYWLIIDASFPVAFLPTVYGGGYLLNTLKSVFSALQVKSRGDQHRYLALVHDYGRLVSQMEERTRGQAESGIFIPKPQLEHSGPLMRRSAENTFEVQTLMRISY